MKYVSLLAFVLSISAFGDGLARPRAIECIGVRCLQSLPGFCEVPGFKARLTRADSLTPRWGSASGTARADRSNVVYDFSDGDQYAFFTVPAQSLDLLARGRVQTVVAQFEDGFDWTNGYNVRARIQLECRAGR